MTMRYVAAALALVLVGAAGAEAAGREKKLPKAASPLQYGETTYVRAKHKGKYDDVTWGTNWKQTLRAETKPLMHSVTAR